MALTVVWKLSYAMKDGLLPIAGEICGLIAGEDGQSRISSEDYAVALIDEAERGEFVRKRFTVGY